MTTASVPVGNRWPSDHERLAQKSLYPVALDRAPDLP